MNGTEEAFLADILAYPEDDTPRLIYADWLEERNEPGDLLRAEFTRVKDPNGMWKWKDWEGMVNKMLWPGVPKSWKYYVVGLPHPGGDSPSLAWVRHHNLVQSFTNGSRVVLAIRHGFIHGMVLKGRMFLYHGWKLFLTQPIERVSLSSAYPMLDDKGYYWSRWSSQKTVSGCFIPTCLFDLMRATTTRMPVRAHLRRYYPDRGDAYDDLDWACISYGRSQVGKVNTGKMK